MVFLNLIFNESLIKSKLLPLNSPSRLHLDDECFTKSAVLFLIIPSDDKPYDLILIRRTRRNHDKHSGEMSFPGGKVESKDGSLEETALRECEEELGISRDNIKLLGCFDDHITPKGYIMTPVVGFVGKNQLMKKQEEEVNEIVRIPISFFANKRNYRERTYLLKEDTIAVGKYNYRDLNGKKYVVFGATSHLIVHYIETVYEIKLMKPGSRRLTCNDIRDRIVK